MANRINISVPDELMDDLNRYKEQIPETVSAVCQKALIREINDLKNKEKYKNKLLDDPKIIEKIEVLKNEREELKKKITELGKTDGEKFLDTITYSELIDMKFYLTKLDIKKIYSDNHYGGTSLDELLITFSTPLKDCFKEEELNIFLSEVREIKYIETPNGFEENEYYNETSGMASIIIAKYLAMKLPQIKPKSNKTVYIFNRLYVGNFLDVLKSFYEIAKDQTLLYD